MKPTQIVLIAAFALEAAGCSTTAPSLPDRPQPDPRLTWQAASRAVDPHKQLAGYQYTLSPVVDDQSTQTVHATLNSLFTRYRNESIKLDKAIKSCQEEIDDCERASPASSHVASLSDFIDVLNSYIDSHKSDDPEELRYKVLILANAYFNSMDYDHKEAVLDTRKTMLAAVELWKPVCDTTAFLKMYVLSKTGLFPPDSIGVVFESVFNDGKINGIKINGKFEDIGHAVVVYFPQKPSFADAWIASNPSPTIAKGSQLTDAAIDKFLTVYGSVHSASHQAFGNPKTRYYPLGFFTNSGHIYYSANFKTGSNPHGTSAKPVANPAELRFLTPDTLLKDADFEFMYRFSLTSSLGFRGARPPWEAKVTATTRPHR